MMTSRREADEKTGKPNLVENEEDDNEQVAAPPPPKLNRFWLKEMRWEERIGEASSDAFLPTRMDLIL